MDADYACGGEHACLLSDHTKKVTLCMRWRTRVSVIRPHKEGDDDEKVEAAMFAEVSFQKKKMVHQGFEQVDR